uniref:Ubiquitin-like protease family profile domain-containing protein n=1 Tax=Solanum lycopersicum TaxID=4081 RepID=A0A3Q7ED17_SOLLC
MDEKKKYYRIDGMPLAMQIWIYECCSAVDSNIAVKKINRIPKIVNWMTRNSRIHYEFLMEGMFSDNGNPLKFKNIEPSLKEIAFYQLESKSTANTKNTFQIVSDKDDDKDDDFTSKPPSHKPHNKEKGLRLKDKRPTVLNDCRKAKSTTLNSDSNPLEDNVSVQEMHNCPDDSANRTPPRSSKEPQDTKADEIGLLRQDLASFKNYANNEFKEFQLFIMGNFRQVMDVLNRSCRESGAPRQEDATEYPSHVPNWSNNNQISNVMDKPHCDANEVRTPRFVLQEHVKINVKEYLQPVQIHIQDPLTVHEQPNDINVFQNHDIQQPQSQIELIDALLPDIDAIKPKKNDVVHSEVVVHPEGVVYDTTPVPVKRNRHPDRLSGDGNVIQNDGIQQPQPQFELLDALLPDIDTIYPKKNVVVHSEVVVRSEGGVYDNTRVLVQTIIHSDQLICSPYSTNIGSSSDLFDDYCLWLSEGLLASHMNKMHDEDRAAGHNYHVTEEIQKLGQLLSMYVSMEIGNDSDDTEDNHFAYDVTCVEDIPQQGSDFLDCGIYLLAFAEYLSEGEGIPVKYLDSKLHRIRYGALL